MLKTPRINNKNYDDFYSRVFGKEKCKNCVHFCGAEKIHKNWCGLTRKNVAENDTCENFEKKEAKE